jgi:amidase
MARTVADLSLLFKVIADPTQFETSEPAPGKHSLRGLRVTWYADDGNTPVTNETQTAVAAAARALTGVGCEAEEARPPGISRGPVLWIELFARAAADQLREFYRGREDQAGPQAAPFLQGVDDESNLNDQINRAGKVATAVLERERWREDLLLWMKTRPLILAPVGATPAFPHGTRRVEVKGESISVFRAFGYAQTFNVFGFPSVVVPAGRSPEGLPIGVQIVGLPYAEELVLAAAAVIESAST